MAGIAFARPLMLVSVLTLGKLLTHRDIFLFQHFGNFFMIRSIVMFSMIQSRGAMLQKLRA